MELPGPSILSTCSRPFAELLKMPDVAVFDHIEPGARLAFPEYDFTRSVAARNGALRQKG